MASSSFSYGWKYDVFLSFRGSDTRHGFTGHLYKALIDKGIHTFIDDEELQRGEEITPSLMKAIEESRIAIPVFSKNYASSKFCLDELVNILACVKKKGRLVLPVFYDVDPSDVRHQRGSFEEALTGLKERLNDHEKLHKWRIALRQAADLSGYHFKHGNENEYDFIGKIARQISQKINRTLLHVADYPVGLEPGVELVHKLLNMETGGVHIVGIHGIGGAGKTTIARAIYNLIADQFEALCFLDNVRENSIKHGLVHLQETLLSKTIGEKGIKLGSVYEGIPIIRHRLHLKKVLLVLDDVDDIYQLRAIVGGTDWFGIGSRIIITTRDRHLLTCHGVKSTCEVHGLTREEALKLLTWSAFKIENVDPCYMNILNRAVTYASGLPLALELIGSNLFGKKIKEWESSLDQYKRIPNKKIQGILKVSFDSLEEDEQKIFLDLVCFFKGYALSYAKEILSCHYGFCPEYGIRVLIEKSLIKIDKGGCVTLHDLIEDMGKEIVRQESPEEPGKRSRLWCPEDIIQVLEENKGTSRIQMITLDYLKYKAVEWDGMAFKEMSNLKTLIIRSDCFTKGPKHLPNSLRVLEWQGYPLPSLPSDFHPKKLVRLQLRNSCIMSLDLFMLKKMFVNMKVLNFNNCQYITEIPDLCRAPNLQQLSCRYCDNLIKIHESVGSLDKLKILDADKCSKLRSFPPMKLTSLEELGLSCCPSLDSFPKLLGKMENVTSLYISYTPIKELPFSIQNLTQLRRIELVACGIVQLPSSIFLLLKLRHLIVRACKGLLLPKENECEVKLSSMVIKETNHTIALNLSKCNISDKFLERGLPLFANVNELYLWQNDFTILPECVKECYCLSKIHLKGCEKLQEIRGIPPNLMKFFVIQCSSLKNLDLTLLPAGTKECHFLSELYLYGCKNLQIVKGIPLNVEVFRVLFCSSLKDLDLTFPPECTKKCLHLGRIILDGFHFHERMWIPYSIQYFSATNCQSLTAECRSMLLSEELHEAVGNKWFCLPGTSIPEWYEHRFNTLPIYFRYCGKFPAISICVALGPGENFDLEPRILINFKNCFSKGKFHFDQAADNLVMFDIKKGPVHLSRVRFPEALSENESNLVEFDIFPSKVVIKQIGMHVFNNVEAFSPTFWV